MYNNYVFTLNIITSLRHNLKVIILELLFLELVL